MTHAGQSTPAGGLRPVGRPVTAPALVHHPLADSFVGDWRGGRDTRPAATLDTGYSELNDILGGGWPLGAMTELIAPDQGVGELELLLPALARLSKAGRWLAWVAPPQTPFAPALQNVGIDLTRVLVIRPGNTTDSLWAMEQCLRLGVCGAVLSWVNPPDPMTWRRLQLAAETGRCWGVLFPSGQGPDTGRLAALRLRVTAGPRDTIELRVLKHRGGWGQPRLWLNRARRPGVAVGNGLPPA